jgi:hypothetical protein
VRVRDLALVREDLRYYFTNGYLIFGKPIRGRRIFALFAAMDGTDDAEIIVRPPNHAERLSLSTFIGSPNLNEHFRSSVLIFTDDTAEKLAAMLAEEAAAKKSEDRGFLLASRWNPIVRNLLSSFEVRIVEDLLKNEPASRGAFYSAINGARTGNFDAVVDPTGSEQVVVGQLTDHSGKPAFDIWASFQSKSQRQEAKPPQDEAKISNYRIEATLDSDLRMSAVTRVTVEPKERISGALAFELSPQMELQRASLDGVPVEIYRQDSVRDALIRGSVNEPLLVVLPQPLEPGRKYELEFHHSGRVVLVAGNNVYFVESRMTWYPQHGLQFSNFDLTFRYPKTLDLVATGKVVEERTDGEQKITRRQTTSPVRLAGFNLGEYAKAEASKGRFQVEVYGNRAIEIPARKVPTPAPAGGGRAEPPGLKSGQVVTMPAASAAGPNPAARLSLLAVEIADELDWMASQFGPPPIELLTVSPIPGYFGQGFPGLIYLSTVSFLNDRDRPAIVQGDRYRTFFSEIIHAHETAHQWWGNLVTSATYHDEWMMEALANYTALLVLEKKKGTKAIDDVLDEYRGDLLAPSGAERLPLDSAGPITWGTRLQSSRGIEVWRTITYEKGSWILHMLRRRMGDGPFLALLGELCKKYAYQPLTTEQFRQLAGSFAPKDNPDPTLEAFFDSWVYSTGIPNLELKSSVRGKAPSLTLSVTVKQTGVSDDYSVDVPIEIRFATGKPLMKWVRTSNDPVTINIPVRTAPTKVELAPRNSILMAQK